MRIVAHVKVVQPKDNIPHLVDFANNQDIFTLASILEILDQYRRDCSTEEFGLEQSLVLVGVERAEIDDFFPLYSLLRGFGARVEIFNNQEFLSALLEAPSRAELENAHKILAGRMLFNPGLTSLATSGQNCAVFFPRPGVSISNVEELVPELQPFGAQVRVVGFKE